MHTQTQTHTSLNGHLPLDCPLFMPELCILLGHSQTPHILHSPTMSFLETSIITQHLTQLALSLCSTCPNHFNLALLITNSTNNSVSYNIYWHVICYSHHLHIMLTTKHCSKLQLLLLLILLLSSVLERCLFIQMLQFHNKANISTSNYICSQTTLYPRHLHKGLEIK